jgi:hypothetical protein
MVVQSFDAARGLLTETAGVVGALREFVEKTLSSPAKKPGEPADARDLPKLFDSLREKLGTKNDFLTKDEIDRAIGDPRIKGEEAQALVALKRHFADIAKLKDDGKDTGERITAADVALATGLQQVTDSMGDTRKFVTAAKRTLYGDNAKPLDSISPDAVVQAGIGNCYYFAALASLADSNPKAIADMIKDNKDGSYCVTLPGSKPVTVQGPTDSELLLFPKPVDKGVWVHVMEKAYGQMCMDDSLFKALRKLRGMEDTPIPQMHTDGGSALDAGLKVLTNKPIGWTWSFKGPEAMHAALMDATKRGVPITADTGLSAKVENGPAVQHVYSMLKYDATAKVLTIRNPWGDTVPKLKGVVDKGKGVFEMPLDTFVAHFSKISYPK